MNQQNALGITYLSWLGRELVLALSKLNPEERAHAYVQFNSWKWPDALLMLKPKDFDQLTHEERYRNVYFELLRTVLYQMTSEYDRSRQWWIEKVVKTEEEHRIWFSEQFRYGRQA